MTTPNTDAPDFGFLMARLRPFLRAPRAMVKGASPTQRTAIARTIAQVYRKFGESVTDNAFSDHGYEATMEMSSMALELIGRAGGSRALGKLSRGFSQAADTATDETIFVCARRMAFELADTLEGLYPLDALDTPDAAPDAPTAVSPMLPTDHTKLPVS